MQIPSIVRYPTRRDEIKQSKSNMSQITFHIVLKIIVIVTVVSRTNGLFATRFLSLHVDNVPITIETKKAARLK